MKKLIALLLVATASFMYSIACDVTQPNPLAKQVVLHKKATPAKTYETEIHPLMFMSALVD